MENYHDGMSDKNSYILNIRFYLVSLLTDVSYVIQHEKDADTVLICHGSTFKRN